MLGFPIPYKEELIYSLVARAGIRAGIYSPKELLDEVFDNRKVIATTDLPCHLQKITEQYPISLGLTLEYLVYKHTLFPIYAPFIPEERRLQCLQWMAGSSQGAVHLALGVAASRIKQNGYFKYCERCFKQQLKEYGEYYWQRIWQVSGVDLCPIHGELKITKTKKVSKHRHEFLSARPEYQVNSVRKFDESERVVTFAEQLLSQSPRQSPSFHQWNCFYHDQLTQSGFNKGRFINYSELVYRVYQLWSREWLHAHNLILKETEADWLKAICRKHRKSFSYLEHLIVITAIWPEEVDFTKIINQVNNYPNKPKAVAVVTDNQFDRVKRQEWLSLLSSFGTKVARSNGGGGFYAWLYRHDREWLLKVNLKYQRKIVNPDIKADWPKRDRKTVKRLFKLLYKYELDLSSPRHSRNWFLKQLSCSSTVERNLHKLPLTYLFFQRYSEPVESYQIRRLTRVYSELRIERTTIKRWCLLRASGLSDERIVPLAKWLLDKVILC